MGMIKAGKTVGKTSYEGMEITVRIDEGEHLPPPTMEEFVHHYICEVVGKDFTVAFPFWDTEKVTNDRKSILSVFLCGLLDAEDGTATLKDFTHTFRLAEAAQIAQEHKGKVLIAKALKPAKFKIVELIDKVKKELSGKSKLPRTDMERPPVAPVEGKKVSPSVTTGKGKGISKSLSEGLDEVEKYLMLNAKNAVQKKAVQDRMRAARSDRKIAEVYIKALQENKAKATDGLGSPNINTKTSPASNNNKSHAAPVKVPNKTKRN
jgi:hypothetical protein